MAATGGGKIRSRRYHIASKPYAKSKQQSGLISRVADTVKSIVPSWLQKYFKNGDAPEGEGTVDGTDQNFQPPPNGSEEGAPPLDGRDSPEPSTSNTEPSTSRASLNFQENVLSRPPLSRSHLHFPPLEASSPTLGVSSSLFSQPSTSSAPGPFSTGFSLVKEIKDNLSQHEDDNISTTSGFSSRASDKDVPTSKTASLPQLWSPETDRTSSGPHHTHSSLKKPAFNLSVFGTSSNSTLNSTMLNSSQLGDSPFYPGKTTYGGAAAVRSTRSRPGTPYQAPVRRQIKAKPAGAQPCGVTSATARRILQSLERMSSPLASMDGTSLDVSHFQAKKKRMDSNHPPVQKLVVPAAASMSGNRSVSFRPTLTPGGVGRNLDRTPRDTPTRQSPQLFEITPGPSLSTIGLSSPGYPLSSTPAASSGNSGGGKMKRERTTARPSSKCPADEEVAEVPDLPSISLPISTSALPTFSFSTPLPSVTTSTSVSSAPNATPAKGTITNKEPAAVSSPPSVPFTFSSPIVKATAASPPSFSPSAGFTFSAPVAKLGPSMSNGKPVKPGSSKSTEEFEGPFKPAKTLKQGSVLDLLKAPGFASPVTQTSSGPEVTSQQTSTQSTATFSSASASSTSSSLSSSAGFSDLFKPPAGWSCDVCLVQNKASDSKCVCCMSPQPNSASTKSADSKASAPPSIGFGGIFSKPTGTWDCDTCLVQNKPDAVKCVACETAKPGTGLKSSLTLPSAFSAVKTVSTPTVSVSTGIIGFGDKFKKPEGSWECDTCMVQNKADDTKCVACTSPKPAAAVADVLPPSAASSASVFGAGDKFKKPEGSWDCDVCLLQNKAADVQCVACQAAKPGAKVEPKGVGNSGSATFGSSTSGPGSFRFGTSDSTSGSGAGGFKFGGSFSESSSSSSGGFKFGTSFGSSSSDTTSKDTTASSGFKFGSSSEGFKFGAASSDDKKSDQPAAGSGFKFGASGGIVFGTGSSSTESNSSKGGFTFGLSKPVEKSADSTTTSSTASFTPPAASQEKSDSTAASNDTTSANTDTSTTTTTTSSSVFGRLGEPSLATATTQGSSTFGSVSAEKELAAPTFSFGKPEEKKEESASPAPSTFLFGAASKDPAATPAPAPSGGFSFSKPSTTTDPPPPAFTFGKPADKSETATTDAPKPTFTFGQSATGMSFVNYTLSLSSAPSATPSPFVFSSGSSGGFGANQTPSFGSTFGSPFTATPSQPPAFGAKPNAAPVFGQQTNSTPVFGAAANSAPSGGFQFGGASAFGTSNNTSGVFTFGGGSAASPTPSASPSIAPQSGAPGGGFSFTQPPTFNIGLNKSFPASPAGQQAIAGRRIKTAVRRRK
uniref:Nuclear pore complex protein Nup153 n=1 Tax=Sphaeramia orbicularis TaxID=375764 RepID=A0A672YHG1_9TELE